MTIHRNMISILGGLSFAATLAGHAAAQDTPGATPEIMAKVFACQTETDDMKRLACFDAAIGTLQQAEDQGEIITVSREQVEQVEKDSFGFNIPSLPVLSNLFGGGDEKSDTERAVAVAAAGRPAAEPKAEPKREVRRAFGNKDLREVQLKIRRIQEFGYKKHRFYLENGQVWEQVDSTRLRTPKVRKGDEPVAYISRAALGSYMLKIDGRGVAVRVQRRR